MLTHTDWYDDGIEDTEQLYRLDPCPDIQVQLFIEVDDDDNETGKYRLFIENDVRLSRVTAIVGLPRHDDIRVRYACEVWTIQHREARQLLESSTAQVVLLVQDKIAQVLAMPSDPNMTTPTPHDIWKSVQSLQEMLHRATKDGILDDMNGSYHPDQINGLCDAVRAFLGTADESQIDPESVKHFDLVDVVGAVKEEMESDIELAARLYSLTALEPVVVTTTGRYAGKKTVYSYGSRVYEKGQVVGDKLEAKPI